jgi:hypothetical protein
LTTPRTVKLSADDEAKETELFDYYGVNGETYSEKHRDLITKCHKAMRLTIVIDTPENPAVHPYPNITIRRCSLRQTITVPHKDRKTGAILWTEQVNVCVNNPPHFTVLPDLKICNTCLEKFYGLAKRMQAANPITHTRSNEPPPKKLEQKQEPPILAPLPPVIVETKPTPPAPKREIQTLKIYHPIANWKPIIRSDGAKVCPYDGIYVYKGYCKKCKQDENAKWSQCALFHQNYQRQRNTLKTDSFLTQSVVEDEGDSLE